MEVFSKSYLKAVVEAQGELFDDFARHYPDCDTDDFITAYMTGKTRADIDAGQAYVCTMNADELMRWYLRESGYQPKPGESMKGFMPDWIGRFYATCQWLERKSSREVFAQVPLAFLKIGYAGLHDLELDLAVRKVCGDPATFEAAARPVDAMVSIASKVKENNSFDAIGTIASTGNGCFTIASTGNGCFATASFKSAKEN